MPIGDIYICPFCGDTFDKIQDDEDARKEYEINFPGAKWEDRITVCDDCYQEIVVPDLNKTQH
jgi:hypothetical protein